MLDNFVVIADSLHLLACQRLLTLFVVLARLLSQNLRLMCACNIIHFALRNFSASSPQFS